MAECFLAEEEGWIFSALTGEVATLTHSLVPNKKMEMYHYLLILQCLDLSLAPLGLPNSVQQFLNMYKRR